jgi:hypothetical protein
LVLAAGLWLAAAAFPTPSLAAGPFADWAAVVVAGDFRAHTGAPSEVFDNARRDVTAALIAAGFAPAHIRQFSVRPERYPEAKPAPSTPADIARGMIAAAEESKGGCLFYLTSHGAPQGAVVGEGMLSPRMAAAILDAACGDRPTIVVISACFSGVFVPAVARPNRMILTAARPDRTSFGCGEEDVYPYFDACMLDGFPKARDFAALGRSAGACVAAKEKAANLSPPSEPQMWVGGALLPILPLLSLSGP